MSIPRLVRQGNRTILSVHDKPFVALAGEVHNSDSSSPAYMEHIWEIADRLGMNTLLLPMSWEEVEPEEGQFDFTLAGELILQARRWGKKIVFLWFGSFKNAEMMYAPAWVKTDLVRFRRGQIEKGKNKAGRTISPSIPVKFPYTTISYLSEEAKLADARAFTRFMGFLRETDSEENTVIAVQVENETGLLGAAREQSDEADQLFAGRVPEDFAAFMKEHTETMVPDVRAQVEAGRPSGSWSEVFGDVAEEMFSAYYVSRFVGFVAAEGKAVYPLPMAVNCWLDKGGDPGSYPTGGPVSRVHEVWQYCAPAVDVFCPDIYVPNFDEICAEFTRRGNPLFIPETATHSYCAPRLVYTVGHYHAMCYSPFGFDDIGKPFSAIQGFLFGMDTADPALKTPQNFDEYGKTGHLLQSLLPVISPKLGSSGLQAACGECGEAACLDFGGFAVNVTFKNQMQPRSDGYCLCVQTAGDECMLLGNACGLRFVSADPQKPNLDLLLAEEGVFDEAGEWKKGRRLNGDETASMSFREPGILRVKFFTYD